MAERYETRFTFVDLLVLFYCALSVLFLAFLLWKYVPVNMHVLVVMNAQLPLPTRLVIFASNWFVRLFPFLVFLGIPSSALALALAIWLYLKKRTVLRSLLAAVGLLASALSAVVVLAMYMSLREVVMQLR